MQEEAARGPSFSRASADGGAAATRISALGHRRRRLPLKQSLSPESLASVREAALAIVRHRIRYLTVVDDGTLVGILAVPRMNRPQK